MAGRQMTKELAVRLVKKLRAKKSSGRNTAHDDYDYEQDGVLIVRFSVRRGSEKDMGHDHLMDQLHLGPNQAKRLAQCPLSEAEYLGILRGKGILPALEEEPSESTAEDEPKEEDHSDEEKSD